MPSSNKSADRSLIEMILEHGGSITLLYKCTCDAKDGPHDVTCERSPHFSGERAFDEAREIAYNLGRPVRRCINDVDIQYMTDTIEAAFKQHDSMRREIDRFKILKCEQDSVDPTKFTVVFKWIPE